VGHVEWVELDISGDCHMHGGFQERAAHDGEAARIGRKDQGDRRKGEDHGRECWLELRPSYH
jgi:hypothetical protein